MGVVLGGRSQGKSLKIYLHNTIAFLEEYINERGKKAFHDLSIKEYNNYVKKYNLLNTKSIKHITGMNWRDFKTFIIK